MPKKKSVSAAVSAKRCFVDPDDAPEITEAMLDRAEIRVGGKVVQRGRPPLGSAAKVAITLRLDPDIVERYRATGPGWQARMNATLRRRMPKTSAGTTANLGPPAHAASRERARRSRPD